MPMEVGTVNQPVGLEAVPTAVAPIENVSGPFRELSRVLAPEKPRGRLLETLIVIQFHLFAGDGDRQTIDSSLVPLHM
jgi:hypothetical protein